MRVFGGLVLGAALIALPQTALAAGPEYDACAAEAASPYEPDFAESGEEDFAVDVAAAIARCETALAAEPGSAEVKAWLARAYFIAKRDAEAFALLDPLPAEGTNLLAATILGVLVRGESAEVALDEQRSLDLLRGAAEAGFAPAQYYYGGSYDNGYGVAQDYALAADWYRKAAEQNFPRGLAALGSMYMYGDGVAFDEAEGLALLTAAAEAGEPAAYQYLGSIYANSPNVAQDYEKAAGYFQKGADLGDAYSLVELGWFYDQGLGVPVDYDKAFALTKKGADLGNAHGKSNLAYYCGIL